jgi:long-chain fatty acid transport protein
MHSSQPNLSRLSGAVLALGLLATGTAVAQILDGATPPIELNYSTPGARSLAMGGAFVGLADDATAAFSNPAGLTTLRAKELGLELRSWDYTATFPDSGHYAGAPTGIGTDTVSGLLFGESSESASGVSFLSYVFAGDGWALAVYDHQLANFESSFQSAGPFVGEDPQLQRLFPVQGRMNLKIENYGASAGFTASDTLSVGLGVSYYDFSFDSVTDRYDVGVTAETFFGTPNYSPTNLLSSQAAKGNGSDWSYNVGMMWRASPKVWLGAVYRKGPAFDFAYTGECGPSDPDYCSSVGGEFTTDGTLYVPTAYAVGLAIKPSDALTVTLDYDRVQYSDMEKGFAYIPTPAMEAELPNFSVDDADEYHLGFEYGFLKMKSPLFLRAGAWLDPSHAIRYDGADLMLQALWSAANAADDQWHYTGGLGMALAGGRAAIDLAVDLSDRVDTYSLSGVCRF